MPGHPLLQMGQPTELPSTVVLGAIVDDGRFGQADPHLGGLRMTQDVGGRLAQHLAEKLPRRLIDMDVRAVHPHHDLSFQVQRGEFSALLGTNGAGRTSTLETVEGHRAATSGNVRVFGADPRDRRAVLAARMFRWEPRR